MPTQDQDEAGVFPARGAAVDGASSPGGGGGCGGSAI